MSQHSRRPLSRRLRCHAFTAGFAAILITCQSCATLLAGGRKYVTVTTNVEHATILIDEDDSLSSGDSIKLRPRKNHSVSVQADGYEPYEGMINKQVKKSFLLNGLLFLPVFVGYPMLWTGIAKDDFALYGAGVGITIGAVIVPSVAAGIDLGVGSAFEFEDSYHYPIYKYPEPLEAPLPTVQLRTVSMEVEQEKIGATYTPYGRERKPIVLNPEKFKHNQEAIILSDHLIRYELTQQLEEHGFSVVDESSSNVQASNGKPGIVMDVQLSVLKLDSKPNGKEDVTSASCTLDWKLTRTDSGETLSLRTSSMGLSAGEVSINAIYSALRHHYFQLQDDPEFRAFVQ